MQGHFAETHGTEATYRAEDESFGYTHWRMQKKWIEGAKTGHILLDGVGFSFQAFGRLVIDRRDDLVSRACRTSHMRVHRLQRLTGPCFSCRQQTAVLQPAW